MAIIKSIEEKAKRYDEALERAIKLKEDPQSVFYEYSPNEGDTICDYIFPELKESEDERIRETLIENFKWFCGDYPETTKWGKDDNLLVKDIIAWLENQGTSYTKRDVDDAYLKGVTDTKNEIEKQYEANYQIRKDIATFIFNYRGDIKDRAKWMDYLGIKVSFVEKQGKQKETLCDQCKKTQPSHSCQDITALGRCALEKQGEQKLTEFERAVKQVMEEAIECGDTHNLKADAEMLLSLVHKSADKVKPRYSTGDVVCDKLCTTLNKDAQPNLEIVNIEDGVYICDKGSFPISQQDNYELVSKKIEQESAWSEEDKAIWAEISDLLWEGYKQSGSKFSWDDIRNWVNTKLLKDRVQPQSTWKPSDEQMDALENAIRCEEEESIGILSLLYNDLKKIREE